MSATNIVNGMSVAARDEIPAFSPPEFILNRPHAMRGPMGEQMIVREKSSFKSFRAAVTFAAKRYKGADR